jgi:hypothetical protein
MKSTTPAWCIRLPPSVRRAIDQRAVAENRSRNNMVERLLNAALAAR